MKTPKQATPNHPIHELITRRWSPYGFTDRPVSDADLGSLFEAARWAASAAVQSMLIGSLEQRVAYFAEFRAQIFLGGLKSQ
ncbi:MAG TPA: nitroreductase family protein [Gemmataceae bacterium]|jgi:nitroreductase|nr:nitroreductase family protein [Gemmataceae bacterium]